MYRYILFVIAACVCLLGVAFHLRNDHLVRLDFYLGSFEFYFSVFIIASIIIGMLLGMLVALPKLMLMKQESKKLQKQIELMDKEVNNLRTLPIKDKH